MADHKEAVDADLDEEQKRRTVESLRLRLIEIQAEVEQIQRKLDELAGAPSAVAPSRHPYN